MRNLITTILLAAITLGGIAQESNKDRIEAQKVAFITKELSLTTEEAQKFWPVHNEYEAEMRTNHKEKRKLHKELQDEELSADDRIKKMEKVLDLEKKEIDIRKKYLTKFQTVLSKEKVAKYFVAEIKFKKHLLKQIKHHQGERQPAPRGDGK